MIETIAYFLFVLGVLIIAHEFGHFLAAKKLGIRVETFSIGLGPKLFGFRKGDTEYRLSLFPLGGFVRMSDGLSADKPVVDFEGRSLNFSERPPLHKIVVAAAGPLMNFLLAFIIFTAIYSIGVKVPAFLEEPAFIGWVKPNSTADQAGLKAGDKILSINNNQVSNWKDVNNFLALLSEPTARVQVSRENNVNELTLQSDLSDPGFYPKDKVLIEAVIKNSPAQNSGLRSNDVIVAINDNTISNWNEFVYFLNDNTKNIFDLKILRGGELSLIKIKPEIKDKNKKYIGVSFKSKEKTLSYSLHDAAWQSLIKIKEDIFLTGKILWKLLSLELPLEILGGPIMIAKASGDFAQMGLIPLLSFMGFLSIQLGFINLVPILPIVDGGQITFYLYEYLLKKPIKISTIEWAAKIGWAIMIFLFIIITKNDIMRLL